MEDIKWSEYVSDDVLESIWEKRMLLNNVLHRRPNLIGHILGRYCLQHDANKGQMTELKGVERRKTQLLDYLRH